MITLPLDLWNSMTNINCYLLQGDSGGPLVCERPGGQWTLFGLTSWGSVCFSKVLGPGVYSNVSYFVEWIERQIYIKTFLQKEFQGWAETLPATHTKHGPLDMKSALPRAAQMGFRGRGAQRALQDLLFAPDPFYSAFSPALSFINFMNSFQSTEHSRFCSFPRLTLNVVWKYQLCRDDIWGSMVTSDRKFLFVLS